jgi:hypothetical protein
VYDQPSGRRFGPALVVFLVVVAGLAGTVGYFGTRNYLDGRSTGSNSLGPSSTSTGGGGGTQTNPSGPATTQGGTNTDTSGPVQPGDATKCPQPTVIAVAAAHLNSQLTVDLYVHVHKANVTDSEVWICQNADGVLIYQGHVLSGPLDVANNQVNTIILAAGILGTVEPEGAGYVAINPNLATGITTEYHITKSKLIVISEPGDQNRTEYPVVDSYPA